MISPPDLDLKPVWQSLNPHLNAEPRRSTAPLCSAGIRKDEEKKKQKKLKKKEKKAAAKKSDKQQKKADHADWNVLPVLVFHCRECTYDSSGLNED